MNYFYTLKIYNFMALKVAVERLLKFDKESAGKYRYVMKADLYTSLTQAKVIKEAALRSGVSQGVMKACWDAAGEVIKAWATEGHSVALPGLGTMRFGLRSKAVEKVEDVETSRGKYNPVRSLLISVSLYLSVESRLRTATAVDGRARGRC